jgi:hypothetical protein
VSDLSEEVSEDQEVRYEVSYDWLRRFLPVFISAAIAFGLAVEIHFRIYHVRPTPLYVFIPAALLGAVFGMIVPLPRRWHAIVITPNQLHLRSRNTTAKIPTSTVSLVAGELGMSFEGGELVVWKRIKIVALGRWYTLMLTPLHHEPLFNSLLHHCSHAIGISARGEVHLPHLNFSSDDALTACRRTITKEFSRQQRYALVAALLAAILGLGTAAVVFYVVIRRPTSNDSKEAPKLLMVTVFSLAGSVLLIVQIFRRGAQKRRVLNALQGIDQPVVSTSPVHVVLNQSPVEREAGPMPREGKWLAILGSVLFLVPIVGVILGVIATYKLRRHQGRWYMLALFATIVGGVWSVGIIVLVLMFWRII